MFAASAALLMGAVPVSAAPSVVIPAQPAPIGPECGEPIRSLVLIANPALPPGKYQYIEPVFRQGVLIAFRYCTITVER